MRLQKQKTDYKRGYHKYVIVLPEELIEKSGFKEGDEIIAKAKREEIKLVRKSFKKII